MTGLKFEIIFDVCRFTVLPLIYKTSYKLMLYTTLYPDTFSDQVGLGLTRECRSSVEHYIKTTPMVFMGYSGCDHFSLTPVLTVTPTEHKSIWLFHDWVNEGKWH